MSDLIDDMLLGDYEYVTDGGRLYADVDYQRLRPQASRPTLGANRTPALDCESTPRRAGAVPARPIVCATPVRDVSTCIGEARPATAAAQVRTVR